MMMDDDFEMSPRDAMNTRITIYRRGQNPATDKGVHMDVAASDTAAQLLRHASERLGVNGVDMLINMNGDVIDDVLLLNQDDILYALVEGESLARVSRSPTELMEQSVDGEGAGEGAGEGQGLVRASTVSETSAQEEACEMVGSYQLGRFLGSGSFGKVYVGSHAMTGERAALKFMNKSSLGSFEDAERVFTEIQCLNSLDHPNVIKLQQVINTPDCVVLALEYASGGDLKDVVDEYGALPDDVASRIFMQILDGVAYCHRHNIVHYDLKLENILLLQGAEESLAPLQRLQALQVKIADFGLSQLCAPGKTSDYTAGSLAYIAPEVLAGGVTAGAPRDVWAMGVILYAIVCGRLPFKGSTFAQVSGNIKDVAYSFEGSDHVSEACCQAIAGMLERNPEERMSVSQIRLLPWVDRGLPHMRTKTPPPKPVLDAEAKDVSASPEPEPSPAKASADPSSPGAAATSTALPASRPSGSTALPTRPHRRLKDCTPSSARKASGDSGKPSDAGSPAASPRRRANTTEIRRTPKSPASGKRNGGGGGSGSGGGDGTGFLPQISPRS